MTNEYKLRILRVRDAPSLSPFGGVTARKAVDWTVDGANIHTTYVAGENFTAAAALALIQPEASEQIALLNKA